MAQEESGCVKIERQTPYMLDVIREAGGRASEETIFMALKQKFDKNDERSYASIISVTLAQLVKKKILSAVDLPHENPDAALASYKETNDRLKHSGFKPALSETDPPTTRWYQLHQ